MITAGPTQLVVVYDKPGQRGIVYDTAYTEAQIQSARIRCINAKRNGCKARSTTAAKHFAEYGVR